MEEKLKKLWEINLNMKYKKILWMLRAVFYKLFFNKIGSMCYMGKPLYIAGVNHISIGDRTRIFPGLRIEAIDDGYITIGKNCVIEQNTHIISKGNKLRIGNDVTIAPNVFITNVNHDYRDIKKGVMDQSLICRDTQIEDGCFVGYGSAIQAGSHLGKHCIVASNTVVYGKFEGNCVIAGNPGKIIKRYDTDSGEWIKC